MKKSLLLAVLFLAVTNFISLSLKGQTTAATSKKTDGIRWMSFEEAIALNKKKPKMIFIDFYTDWCGWCKKEIPFIRKAYHALKDKNVAFVTMMMDDRKEAWLHEIKEYNIEWYCLSDLKGMKNSPLTKAYNLGGIPDSFVVDPEGRIVCRDLRGE